MMRFLGSIWFTLLLILFVALYTMGGTLVEALTGSHQQALLSAYRQPAFLLLLAGFFINILLAALRRWPWRSKHLPFLFAHLGLLMIIAGVAIKQVWGVQAVLLLAEGGASETLLLPGTYRVVVHHLEGPAEEIALFDQLPHCEVHYTGWVKNGLGDLVGLPPIPMGERVRMPPWEIAVEGCSTVEEWRPTAAPMIALLQDGTGESHIALVGQDGAIERHPFRPEPLYAIDGGFGGYEVALPFDQERLLATDEEKRGRRLDGAARAFDEMVGQLPVPLSYLAPMGGEGFARCIDRWDRTGCALFPIDEEVPQEAEAALLDLSWHTLSPALQRGMGWCSRLLGNLPPDRVVSNLEGRHWPIEGCETAGQVCAALLNVGAELPSLPPPLTAAERLRHLSAYLLAHEIDMSHLPEPEWQKSELQIATRLGRAIEVREPLRKREENRPAALVTIDGERMALPYEPLGQGLMWPTRSGKTLLRFEPKQMRLPFSLRLLDARQINYPGTNQPYAYEADIEVGGESATLSMNRVYERAGYRFYLSSLAPADETALQTIQLTVNRDPARWKLTYPGCMILVLGILLLYPKLKRRALS